MKITPVLRAKKSLLPATLLLTGSTLMAGCDRHTPPGDVPYTDNAQTSAEDTQQLIGKYIISHPEPPKPKPQSPPATDE